MRGATKILQYQEVMIPDFYSHASCEARQLNPLTLPLLLYFYSHASCEARLIFISLFLQILAFLLTRLLRGATLRMAFQIQKMYISTHTPLARRDLPDLKEFRSITHFYSHASCEARRAVPAKKNNIPYFYSHASCEARLVDVAHKVFNVTFLLTRLLRGATA